MKLPSRSFFPFLFSLFTAALCAAADSAPSADALRAEADALAADIAARLGSSVRPGVPFPGYRPPVAPDADPFAAIDPDAFEADRAELARLTDHRPKPTPSSPIPDYSTEAARRADVLPRLTNLAAAADAFATPGYRSSLPGLVFPPDGPSSPDTYWIEPRFTDAVIAARYLVHRIRLALAQGNPASALADRARLLAVTDILLREPGSLGPSVTVSFRNPAAYPDLPPDALADAARDASALADDLEARWPDLLLSSFHCDLSDALVNLGPAPDDTPADVWVQTLRLAAIRCLDTTADAIRAALALPPGPERAAALSELSSFSFGPEVPSPEILAKETVTVAWHGTFITLARSRDNASVVLAAVALLRYHRDTGALPDTLGALVPDYLPALPLAFADGASLTYTPVSTPLPGFTLSFPAPHPPTSAFFPLPPSQS